MYWDGVAREVASALVAFAEICQLHPAGLPEETVPTRELVSARLPKLQSPWDPTIGREIQEQGNIRFGPLTIRRSRRGVDNLDPRRVRARARALLQATGLLDVDIASEYRDPVLSCLAPPPQVHVLPHVLVARQCSECRWPIRSYHFYECAEGCTDPKGCTSDQILTDADADALPALPGLPAQYRAAREAPSRGGGGFARQLDAWEDGARRQTSQGLSVRALNSAATAALQKGSHPLSRRVFPDGNTHATLMFGPLLIENGAGEGVRIALRSPPALGIKTAHEMDRYLARDADLVVVADTDGTEHEVVTSVEYKLAENRTLFTRRKSKLRRRLVRCEKQIAGGLFTGHNDAWVEREDNIVRCFLARAEDWRAVTKSRRLTEKQRLEKLHAFAAEICDTITGRLRAPRRPLPRYLNCNPLRNNCQKFCNNMVFRSDEDSIYFHRQFPFMMPVMRREHAMRPKLPAHLMGFACDAPHGAVSMANRGIEQLGQLQSSMQLHGCVAHNPADAIDHAASVRYKADTAGRSVWASPSNTNICHDDILLKAPNTTCPTEPPGTGRRACTFADHLLDCPFDNLCVLTLHAHRDMRYYAAAPSQDRDGAVQQGRQLTSATAGERREWLANRLRVLHRTYALNAFLAQIARQYDVISRRSLPADPEWIPQQLAHMLWEPGSGAEHGRAWWYQKASGPSVYTRDTEDAWPAWTHLKPKERLRALELTVVRSSGGIWKTWWRGLRGYLKDRRKL
ncbi:hypothetical protein QBC34DRAFT_426297 [Podospora aff. communis PSN243]|uniref:Uncharacterized protein n=1 Tax=Podospora aff. communis PSN243 TaxID=3040156 RepID=A0AAV9GK40_9PEZI|nr:hypothetical protein QBC34DRAFT_426297 [Podospora aff. communis PSN243]